MASWLDSLSYTLGSADLSNFQRMKDPLGLSRSVPDLPRYYSPADAAAHYLVKGALGAADLAKLPISAAAQVPDASSALFDWFTTKKDSQAPFDNAAKTAEKAIAPSPEETAKAAADKIKQEADAKKQQEDMVVTALANQPPAPPRGATSGGGASVKAPEFQAPMAQAEPTTKKDDTDYSKAMLRAGIAMMSSKGDIWDALAAGFGGYATSLDKQEEDKAKAAKEAYDRQLEEQKLAIEKYKADIYGAQTMASINQMNRKGAGGGGINVGDQINLMKLRQDQTEYAQKVRETMVDLKMKAAEAKNMGDTATYDSLQKDIYDMGVSAGIITPTTDTNTGAAALGGFLNKK